MHCTICVLKVKRSTNKPVSVQVSERLEQLDPKPYKINGMSEVVAFIKSQLDRHFFIIGDYDVDGVMATGIMYKVLTYLGADVEYYIPHRFTDGYGANPAIVSGDDKHTGVPNGSVVIMVDNGIVTFPAVDAANEKGCDVIIIDHHLKAESGILPNAKFIIDPNAIEGQCEFTDYCGAGLCYKFAEECDLPAEFLEELSALAAYATIADVVPLKGENWLIASNLDKGYCNTGLNAIMKEMNVGEEPTSDDAGFKVCPAINAPGRLIDDGATQSLELILEQDPTIAEEMAKELKRLNDERKALVECSLNKAEKIIASEGLDKCIAIVADILSGIVGIVAGKLAEKYHVPAFIFAKQDDSEIIKGSARTYGDNHLKRLLDITKDLLLKYGGHAAAAGLSMEEANLDEFKKVMNENITIPEEDDVIYYQGKVTPDNFVDLIEELEKAAPYGEGNPPFMFKADLTIKDNKPYVQMGKFLKLITNEDIDVLCFDIVPETGDIGKRVEVVGPISVNKYKGKIKMQIEAKHLTFKGGNLNNG